MKKFLIIVLSLFSSSAFSQAGQESEVWARVEALNKAVFETKDSTAIDDLVAGAVTYGHSTGDVEEKALMVRNAVHNPQVYSNLSVERLGATNVGQTYILRYILRGNATKDGTTSPLNISILQVWSKEGGKWRLFARQAVKVNPK